MTKHTQGPLRAERDSKWPYHPRIVDASGNTILSEYSHAFSSAQSSRRDFDTGAGFHNADDGAAAVLANERQFANFVLWAGAPRLLAALQVLVAYLADSDEEGLIEHAEQMIEARAAIADAMGDAS